MRGLVRSFIGLRAQCSKVFGRTPFAGLSGVTPDREAQID